LGIKRFELMGKAVYGPYVFKVTRDRVAAETARVILEVIREDEHIELTELGQGPPVELITGFLAVDPFEEH
jgi:hypothetical protein